MMDESTLERKVKDLEYQLEEILLTFYSAEGREDARVELMEKAAKCGNYYNAPQARLKAWRFIVVDGERFYNDGDWALCGRRISCDADLASHGVHGDCSTCNWLFRKVEAENHYFNSSLEIRLGGW